MATQAEINAHDRVLLQFATRFGRGIAPLFTQLFDAIAANTQPTRTSIAQAFTPINTYVNQQLAELQSVVAANIELNSAALGTAIDAQTQQNLRLLREEAAQAILNQLAQEQNTITNAVMLAVATGILTAATLRSLRGTRIAIVKRITQTVENTARQFDGALTVLRGRNAGKEIRYRYAGGIIAESRDFCRQMDGRVLTETEIRRIWSSQTWGGKRPGDPFVTRGGYNCRHSFVPVAEDE